MAKRKVIPADETATIDDFVAPDVPEEVAAAETPIEEPVPEPELEPVPPAPPEKPKKAVAPPTPPPPPLPRPQPGDLVRVRLVGAPQAILIVGGQAITVIKGETHTARYAHYRQAWQANKTAWEVKYPGAAAFLVEAD